MADTEPPVKRRPPNVDPTGSVLLKLDHELEAALRKVSIHTNKGMNTIVARNLSNDPEIQAALADRPLPDPGPPLEIQRAAETIGKWANVDPSSLIAFVKKGVESDPVPPAPPLMRRRPRGTPAGKATSRKG